MCAAPSGVQLSPDFIKLAEGIIRGEWSAVQCAGAGADEEDVGAAADARRGPAWPESALGSGMASAVGIAVPVAILLSCCPRVED